MRVYNPGRHTVDFEGTPAEFKAQNTSEADELDAWNEYHVLDLQWETPWGILVLTATAIVNDGARFTQPRNWNWRRTTDPAIYGPVCLAVYAGLGALEGEWPNANLSEQICWYDAWDEEDSNTLMTWWVKLHDIQVQRQEDPGNKELEREEEEHMDSRDIPDVPVNNLKRIVEDLLGKRN